MLVFIDDSGDAGMKFRQGSSTHLVMTACVFKDLQGLSQLAHAVAAFRAETGRTEEVKHSKLKERNKEAYFTHMQTVDYFVRAIAIDKTKLTSEHLASDGRNLKSYAIRLLLTHTFGTIRDATVIIDGDDMRAFGYENNRDYLLGMCNRESPGTVSDVAFADSAKIDALQLADMVAGVVRVRAEGKAPEHLPARYIHVRQRAARYRGGSIWNFPK